jgi:DNA-binding MarR family transcriptional regulator
MDTSARTSFIIRRLQMQIGALIEQELRKLAVTNGQYAVLATIAKRNGSSSADIARRLRVKPQALNEFIPPLEARGFIKRQGHPDNRRILSVYTTPEGEDLLKACDEAVDRLESDFFSVLTGDELEILRGLTFKLIERANHYEPVTERAARAKDEAPRARGFE